MNDLMFYMILSTTFLSLAVGYVFDIFGRKKVILLSFLSAALFMGMIPLVSPSIFPGLVLLRIGIGISIIAPNCHPLVTDYVRFNHRGKATALQSLGQLLGELFTYGALFHLSKMLNYTYSFSITACLISLGAFLVYSMMKEPQFKKSKKQQSLTSLHELSESLEQGG